MKRGERFAKKKNSVFVLMRLQFFNPCTSFSTFGFSVLALRSPPILYDTHLLRFEFLMYWITMEKFTEIIIHNTIDTQENWGMDIHCFLCFLSGFTLWQMAKCLKNWIFNKLESSSIIIILSLYPRTHLLFMWKPFFCGSISFTWTVSGPDSDAQTIEGLLERERKYSNHIFYF